MTMRRVRLEKLCETKKVQAERAMRRTVAKRRAPRARRFLAGPFGFGGGGCPEFRSSIEHVVQSSWSL